jgi:S-adenosylmethionine hydrolase
MVGGVERAVVLNNSDFHLIAPGATFAGRDVFAPVAAHLCNGVSLDELGEPVDPDILMPGLVTLPQIGDTEIITEVTWVDTYGNCQLNVGPEDVALLAGSSARLTISVNESLRSAPIVSSFDSIDDGAVGLVIDSYGMLAVCKRQDSAARDLGIGSGDQVVLRAASDGPAGVTTRVEITPGHKPV